MDFLEQPDIKQKYDKCKYIVKVWEHKFTKKHKRLPSRLDIKEAPSEVRNAYKKYFLLKSQALEQSFRDVEGFNDLDDTLPLAENVETENKNSLNVPSENAEKEDNVETNFTSVEDQLEDMFKDAEKETSYFIPEETWGTHLNNSNKKETKAKCESNQSKLTSSISKKLFCGSKFHKRNPRKSLSFSQKNKSENNVDLPNFLSQPMHSISSFMSEELSELSQELFKNDSLKILNPVEKITSQPIQISHENFDRPLRTIDAGWLSRVAEKSGITVENPELNIHKISSFSRNKKIDYDSEDIIDESDEEMSSQKDQSFQHVSKKRKVDETLSSQSNVTSESFEIALQELNKLSTNAVTSPSSESIENRKNAATITSVTEDVEKLKIHACPEDVYEFVEEPVKNKKQGKKTAGTKMKAKPKTPKNIVKEKESEQLEEISPRRSSRVNKVKASFLELDSSEEDPFHSDNDEKDPEFTVEKTKKQIAECLDVLEEIDEEESVISRKQKPKASTRQKKTLKMKTPKKKDIKEDTNEKDPENESYELEFSIKPRIVAPRYNNIKKVLSDQIIQVKSSKPKDSKSDPKLPKDKRQQEKDKFLEKVSSGNLNDNYVTIDLKRKIFARGKSGFKYSKWKKAQWKSKKKALCGPEMDMTGCDGGMLTCFNCGQIGHFARQCKNTKGDGLLPLTATESVEEECPYPTLQEASDMAKESVLSIRRPQKDFDSEQIKDGEEHDSDYVDNDEEYEAEDEEGCFDDDESDLLLSEALKLEDHVKKLDVRMYMDRVKIVEPYYQCQENDSLLDTPDEVYATLQKFGHTSFRQGQETAVMRILSGKSTLVTLSTGSGKSLCYQLPAYLYSQREPCISLVISPLVSLMEDQVSGIPKFLKAACLHTNQTKTQREKVIDALSKGELSILLISPEALVAGEKQTGFGSIFRRLPPIAFACIDEAHCVSQWSHNFRPSYLLICRVLRESLGVKTILGLTATATRATEDSIIEHIAIPDGRNGIISDVPLPNNLILSVSKDRQRDAALLALLMSPKFVDCKSIIVYCTRRDECERVATFLRTTLKGDTPVESNNKKRKRFVNIQAEPYHAGMSASRRRTIQNKFMSGELRIVVATVAFGMGINKADIRSVIHFNMPSSFESYVQEIGRAGRDGLKAYCHLFLDSEGHDENELRRHIHSNSIDRHVIRKLLQKVFVPCSCKSNCPKHEVAFSIEQTVRALDIPEENISTLLCYLELHKNKYIELLSPAYTVCKVISYGGPHQIRKMAKDCPPLAMALALHKSKAGQDANVLEFPVVDVAAAMGWESGICKHKLKNLEWTNASGAPKRSTLSVQFSNLGFRMLAPGNLNGDQLDETLDSIYSHVVEQERKASKQLHVVHEVLVKVAKPTFRVCSNDEGNQCDLLKQNIREYFNSPDPIKDVEEKASKVINEEQLVADIRNLVCMYRDNQFTGRAVARIMHGIQSPNYPAVIWKKCKFWRSHLAEDFHEVCRIATREIIKLR